MRAGKERKRRKAPPAKRISTYMGTWSTGHGKFIKKDPNHGWLGRWLKDNWNAFWKANTKCCKRCKCDEKDKSPHVKGI